MTYKQSISYLDSFYNFEKKSKPRLRYYNLDRILKLARLFDDPQDDYYSVHITGTKGKGSTSAFIANILSAAGYKVGLYTSPHLYDLRERIKIDNRMISPEEFASQVSDLREKLKKSGTRSYRVPAYQITPGTRSYRVPAYQITPGKGFRPSYFEALTTIAFNYFSKKNVDFAVFEVGMGGRLDATNIISPVASAITSISLDHMRELGGTLRKIAYEKAGIIKHGVPVVSAHQRPEVLKVIKKYAALAGAHLYTVGKDIEYTGISCSPERELFSVGALSGDYNKLCIGLLGEHQLENAAIAAGLADIIRDKGFAVPKNAVRRGLSVTKLPGRCEIVGKMPLTILDTAHNKASFEALITTVNRNFKYKKFIVILGLSKGKDIKGIADVLDVAADTVIITKAKTSRAENPDLIKRYFKKARAILAKDPAEAKKIAGALAGKDDIIAVAGSFYLAGEFEIRNSNTEIRNKTQIRIL